MDGVHVLRKRQHSRLWYRQPAALTQRSINAVPSVKSDLPPHPDDDAWERLFAELGEVPALESSAIAPVVMTPVVVEPTSARAVAVVAEPVTTSLATMVTTELPAPASTAPVAVLPADAASDDWRVVQKAAPAILLSATDLLDARDPGPVLRPGVSYRIASVQNGVVGLDVIDPSGEEGGSGLGYCAAVDLICIDRRFANYQPGRAFSPSTPFRSRVNRWTGSLSQATTSLFS